MRRVILFSLVILGGSLLGTSQTLKLPLSRDPVLRSGMSLAEAMRVALNCVREASGYKTVSESRKIRLYRPEDKISDLGITSSDRLNALRRYVVRNEEIGVQSVFDLDTPTDFAYHPRRYIISRDKLAELTSGWTLLKLAQTIQKSSGLPRLPFPTAASIVADCLKYRDTGATPGPKPAEPQISIPSSSQIEESVARPLVSCIVSSRDYGVYTAKLYTPEDEKVNYFLSKELPPEVGSYLDREQERESIDFIVNEIKTNGWTFKQLIAFVATRAQVKMPLQSVAAGIVITNILKQQRDARFSDRSRLGEIESKNGELRPANLNLDRLGCDIARDLGNRSLVEVHCSDLEGRPLLKGFFAVTFSNGQTFKRAVSVNRLPISPQNRVSDLMESVQELIIAR